VFAAFAGFRFAAFALDAVRLTQRPQREDARGAKVRASFSGPYSVRASATVGFYKRLRVLPLAFHRTIRPLSSYHTLSDLEEISKNI